MNNNELGNQPSVDSNRQNQYYQATSNLNVAMESPQVNINSTTGINMQSSLDDVNNIQNNSVSSEINETSTEVVYQEPTLSSNNINNEGNSNYVDTSFVNNSISGSSYNQHNQHSTSTVQYEPVMQNSKEEKSIKKFTLSKELKIVIFLAFILIIFVLLIPYIYDFFERIRLTIINR